MIGHTRYSIAMVHYFEALVEYV